MILVDQTHAVMEASDLSGLGEYSTTLPTGTTAGKRWKCKTASGWRMGEYGASYLDERGRAYVPITWRVIIVVGGEESRG